VQALIGFPPAFVHFKLIFRLNYLLCIKIADKEQTMVKNPHRAKERTLIKIDQPKSKTQNDFNKYTARVEKLRKKIAKQNDHLEGLLAKYNEIVLPVENKITDVYRQLVRVLDGRNISHEVPRRMSMQTAGIIQLLLKLLLHNGELDEELTAIYAKYNDGKSPEEERLEYTANKYSDYFFKETGFRIDVEELKKEEPDFESLNQKFKEFLEAGKKPGSRRKTKKQLEREAMEAEKEKLKNQSLRSIYLNLAKILHPDMENDPVKRAEKEDFMKKATAAYEAKDLLALLHLEMIWMRENQTDLDNLPETKLMYFIELLKDQIKQLDQELSDYLLSSRYKLIQDYVGLPMNRTIYYLQRKKEDAEDELDLLTEICDDLKGNNRFRYALDRCRRYFIRLVHGNFRA